MIMNRKSWYSKAKILEIKYEYPILRMTTGVKKDRQDSYDNSPYLHGSNGTYVENSNKFFNLNFLVYNIDPCHTELAPSVFEQDVNEYRREILMPRLDWQKMTLTRLSLLNDKIKEVKLKVITWDMEEVPIYRNYVPFDYNNSWENFLNDVFQDL